MDDCVRAPQSRSPWLRKLLTMPSMVPASALLKGAEGAATVMIVSQDRAHQVAVETGIRQGDHVQITKGLGGGETGHRERRLRPARQHSGETGSAGAAGKAKHG